jgi:DNA-binding CsgD family transcriptional regulator
MFSLQPGKFRPNFDQASYNPPRTAKASEAGWNRCRQEVWDRLSARKREVWSLHAEGLSPAEIGRRLMMSEFTATMFLENVRVEIDLHERRRRGESMI